MERNTIIETGINKSYKIIPVQWRIIIKFYFDVTKRGFHGNYCIFIGAWCTAGNDCKKKEAEKKSEFDVHENWFLVENVTQNRVQRYLTLADTQYNCFLMCIFYPITDRQISNHLYELYLPIGFRR